MNGMICHLYDGSTNRLQCFNVQIFQDWLRSSLIRAKRISSVRMSLKKNTNTEITNSLKNSLKNIKICDSFAESDKINKKKVEISLIEDSSDGLQWCAELDYEYKR